MKDSVFLKTIKGEKTYRPPVWFMRQAGRVLPSYLELKEKYSFWQMMQTPKLAAKVTLLPVYDLGVDAAILFSDILVIPYSMGMGLEFTDNGPVFDKPLKDIKEPLKQLKPQPEKLQYIYNAIDQIIATRPDNTPLIGFCGAPLTVLCYMIQGLGSKSEFPEAVKYIFRDKETINQLIEQIVELSIIYALNQIKHGIDVFQLFETHAGLIPVVLYKELFLPAVKKIADAVRATGIPFIFFPKGYGTGIFDITPEICDYLSIDWQTSITFARKTLDNKIGVQGNLDPRILFTDKETIKQTLETYTEFGSQNQNWIFNLGHGLMPGMSFENTKFVIDWIKNNDWKRS